MISRKFKLFNIAYLFIVCAVPGATAAQYWATTYGIVKGSTLVLNKPATVEALSYKVYIQGGQIKEQKLFPFTGGYDEYSPFCYLELGETTEHAYTITPDTFLINKVRLEETTVSSIPIRVASNDADGGVELIVQLLIMELNSAKQPEVEQLVCAEGYDLAGQEALPQMQHILDVLGDVATLRLINSSSQ